MARVSRLKQRSASAPSATRVKEAADAGSVAKSSKKSGGVARKVGPTATAGRAMELGGGTPVEVRRTDAGEFAADHIAHGASVLRLYIDEANSNGITGWVWNPQAPEERISLEVLDDGIPLARVLANQYRADLEREGIGDGCHAFAIPLSETLLSAVQPVLRLRSANTGAELFTSPITIERPMPKARQRLQKPAAPYLSKSTTDNLFDGAVDAGAEAELFASKLAPALPDSTDEAEPSIPWIGEFRFPPYMEPALQSHIDFADLTGIKGWVWDPQEPQKRIALDLLDGETRLARVLATEYREDLEAGGKGDGCYGFWISFSETLLPYARHVLHLRPVGCEIEIPPFPIVLTREHSGFDPVIQLMLSNVVAEAAGAEQEEDLAPIINTAVRILDTALARYFFIEREDAAKPIDLLNPEDLSSAVGTMLESIQSNYPTLAVHDNTKPIVSIIVPVFNNFGFTYNSIKSIVEHGARINFEIIIVDDCSRDETLLASFVFGAGIRLIRNPENLGFIRSCNRGADAARGEYIVFLNNDTQVKARWLDELYDTMQQDPKIGVVGAKLLFPDGSLQECGGIIWRLGDGWNWGREQAADDPRFCYMRDADYVSGAALMIKLPLFRELKGFDEYYLPMYYEDTDLCFRVRDRGYRVVVQPASEVIHFEGASSGTSTTGTGMKRFQTINHRKFFERWKDVLVRHRFNGEMPELEAERSVRRRALFIDNSIPEPDKDAGSNAAFEHMLSLQRLGFKVTFIPADNMARIEPYTSNMQRRGIECLYHPYYFSVEDVFRKKPIPFDLVYVHRYSNASKYAGMIRQHFPNARIIYCVADLHFLRLQREAAVQNDIGLREEADQLRQLEVSAMSFVDCVIVHSAAEAELLREIAPHVEVAVIPWTIATRELKKTEVERPAIAFIGGYRHTPNIDGAKWAVQSIMPVLRKLVPGIELLLVGSHMPPELSSLAAADIVPLGYVPSLDDVFERVQLTMAPLRYGAGIKGKVLESFAAGIPCVMTSVAAEGIDLPSELKLLVADDAEGLAERVATLCHDKAKYHQVVNAGKAHVEANYSAGRIDALIRQACRLDFPLDEIKWQHDRGSRKERGTSLKRSRSSRASGRR